MKNIVLFCSAGMSTSLLVSKMRKSAEERGIECKINAYSLTQMDSVGPEADVILLGPQVRFNLKKVQETLPQIPVDVIDMRDYGTVNGAKVLDFALSKIKD